MAVPYIPPVTSSSQGTGEPAGCRWVLTTAPLIFVGLVSGIGILMTGSEVLHGRAGFIVWFLVWVAIFAAVTAAFVRRYRINHAQPGLPPPGPPGSPGPQPGQPTGPPGWGPPAWPPADQTNWPQ
jgi:hypothetical protein